MVRFVCVFSVCVWQLYPKVLHVCVLCVLSVCNLCVGRLASSTHWKCVHAYVCVPTPRMCLFSELGLFILFLPLLFAVLVGVLVFLTAEIVHLCPDFDMFVLFVCVCVCVFFLFFPYHCVVRFVVVVALF